MASYDYTFNSGDGVTPTRLNAARTVSNIVNADISATAGIVGTKIANDTIVNANIKSDAAIAGTKIAPDFGSQNVLTTGRVSTGDAPRAVAGTTPSIGAHGTVGTRFAATRWTADASGPDLNFFKSRGAAIGTRGAVQSGDTSGAINFYADDGTNDVFAARIFAQVDGTPGTNDMPGRLVFSTTADGASTPTERMRITQAGNVGIANTSPSEKLDVTGNIKASGYIDADTSFRGQSSDSASAPSFTWTDDTNTGMFRPAADTIAFSEGGVERMRIRSDGDISFHTTGAINVTTGTTNGITIREESSVHISRDDQPGLYIQRTSGNGAVASFYRNTGNVGSISITTTATTYATSSDYRLKENPTPLIGGLATINQLQPCQFTWKSDGSIGRGFIAHELQAVVPEAVTGEKDAVDADGKPRYQGVDAAKLVPYLVSAVKELKTRVEALEAA